MADVKSTKATTSEKKVVAKKPNGNVADYEIFCPKYGKKIAEDIANMKADAISWMFDVPPKQTKNRYMMFVDGELKGKVKEKFALLYARYIMNQKSISEMLNKEKKKISENELKELRGIIAKVL